MKLGHSNTALEQREQPALLCVRRVFVLGPLELQSDDLPGMNVCRLVDGS